MSISQIVNIIVNSSGVPVVTRQLQQMGDTATQTGTYLNSLRGILASVMTFSGVGQIMEAVDTFTQLQNRLKQVTSSAQEAQAVWQQLINVANGSYSSIDSTATLYHKVAIAFKSWGGSAKEAMEFTNLFQKAAVLSGSTVQTTSQAVYQFSQALNKGKLDGDEFRSVLEGLPYVAALIEKQFGVTRKQLYEMSKDGQISVDRLRKAFTDAASVIENDFAKVTPTIGMALVVLQNKWIEFVGWVQTSTGVFSLIAYAIIAVANNFTLLSIALAPVVVAFAFLSGRMLVGLLVVAFTDMGTAIRSLIPSVMALNAAMWANPYVLAAAAIVALVGVLVYFREEIGLTDERLKSWWTSITEYLAPIGSMLSQAFAPIIQALSEMWTWLTQVAEVIYNGVIAGFTALFDIAGQVLQAIVAYLSKQLKPLFDQIVEAVGQLISLFMQLGEMINNTVVAAVTWLKQKWDEFYAKNKEDVDATLRGLGYMLIGLKEIGGYVGGALLQAFDLAFTGVVTLIRGAIAIVQVFLSLLQKVVNLISSIGGMFGGGGGNGISAARGVGAAIGAGAKMNYGGSFYAGEFANGGGFKVGGTNSGRDTTGVSFRANRGERVSVETKRQQRMNDNYDPGSVNVPVEIKNILDPNGVIDAVTDTDTGRKKIINLIRINRDEVREALGSY